MVAKAVAWVPNVTERLVGRTAADNVAFAITADHVRALLPELLHRHAFGRAHMQVPAWSATLPDGTVRTRSIADHPVYQTATTETVLQPDAARVAHLLALSPGGLCFEAVDDSRDLKRGAAMLLAVARLA